MQILEQKLGTKRPVIVRAATSLFSGRGIDATSMRHIADASGIRESAIYRHFASKEELSREIFASWYGWYSGKLCEIVRGPGSISEKLRRVAAVELATAEEHTDAFLYFCENEPRFLRSLSAEVPRARAALLTLIRDGQRRNKIRKGNAGILADMLSGALCGAALSWVRRGRPGSLKRHATLVADACWGLVAA